MGSDDLFHKRKARKAGELQRIKNDKRQGRRFLLVCEGKKTEPYYFRELLSDLRIPPQRVKIAPHEGSSPDKIVEQAINLQRAEIASGDGFDAIYCVFDRDSHTTFAAALERIKTVSAQGTPLKAITSTPCFEFWLLLHFAYSDAPFHAAGRKSVAAQAVSQLKRKPGWAEYDKGQAGTYTKLKAQLPNAIAHAKRLRNSASQAQGIANPWCNVDELVEALLELSKP